MKLPAKVNYAIKALIELSLRYGQGKPVQLGGIAAVQKIPKNFLLQLLIRLKNAGLVKSTRGVAGGYILARDPGQITLADVVTVIDDAIIDAPRRIASQNSNADKAIARIWNEMSRCIVRELEKVSLEALSLKIKDDQLTYYI